MSKIRHTIVDNPKNKSAIAVHESLPSNVDSAGGDPDLWAGVDAIASAVGLSKSTVSKQLAKLADDGLAESYKGEGNVSVVWRRVERDPDTVPPVESAADESADAPAPDGKGKGSGVADVAAQMRATRPVSAPPANAPEPKTATCTAPGCGETIVKDGRSWKHEEPLRDQGHKATTAKSAAPAEPTRGVCAKCEGPMMKIGRSWQHTDSDDKNIDGTKDHKATSAKPRAASSGSGNGERFKPGELRQKTLAFLVERASATSVAEIAEHTGASASSAAYAAFVLVRDGKVTIDPATKSYTALPEPVAAR